MARGDPELDRLFQRPPGEFTAARNALAKTRGAAGAEIRSLSKPPLAAWAINQLFWKKPDVYEALVDSAEEVRRAHKAVLTGRGGDIRAASKAHDRALDTALKETLRLLEEGGHAASESTRQSLVNTLRALPGQEPPGRLTHTLQPGGFELLTGIAPRPGPRGTAPRQQAKRTAPATHATEKKAREMSRAAARDETAGAREALSAAGRDLREAEQAARREEFEAARAAREATKAAGRLEAAREALAAAQQGVDEAEREHASTEKKREDADRRARRAAEEVDAARARVETARAALDSIRSPSSRDR